MLVMFGGRGSRWHVLGPNLENKQYYPSLNIDFNLL